MSHIKHQVSNQEKDKQHEKNKNEIITKNWN